jgi:hypothetical protein
VVRTVNAGAIQQVIARVPGQVSGEIRLVISEIEDDQRPTPAYAGLFVVLDEFLQIPLADNQAAIIWEEMRRRL